MNKLEIYARIILVTFSLLQHYKEVAGECHFPEYVQSPLDEFQEPMPWQTKVWWLNLRNDPKLREMQEVYVHNSQIWSQRQSNRWSCDRKARRLQNRATSTIFGNCSEKYLLYNRTCLSEERYNRFKVVQTGPNGDTTFVCLMFVKRSDTVVQIMKGPTRLRNDKDLCDDKQLQLEEWPWVAPWRREMTSCPISGGFSFRTVNRLTNEDFCEDEWRKSRLEIDCSKGDGLQFIAPKGSRCNPFSNHKEVSQFYCWAGWQEKHYTFLVVGENKGVPQYCLRFPRDLSGDFTVIVYFSVLCPTQADGMPPTGMEYHEMKMSTLDPKQCIDDDSERCQMVMKKGHCKKEEKYGAHCELSCGKCDEREDMLNMQCPFSSMIHGRWSFIDLYHNEKVKINHTMAYFADFGTFMCKERSASSDKLYKTVSVFNNGCAMRYTCFEFHRRNNNILQFRVGSSFRVDNNFDTLCRFEDNAYPVMDTYRSNNMKNLILDGRLWDEFCGFSNTIPFNGTIYGEACAGNISDWDPDGCVTRGVLKIKSNSCTNLAVPMEYQCLAFLADSPLEHFVITRSKQSGSYNCWVLTSYLCDGWSWDYRVLYKLDSPQCTTLAGSGCIIDTTPEALLYLHDENKKKHCKGEDRPRVTFATTNVFGDKSTTQIHKLPYYNYPENSKGKPETHYYSDGVGLPGEIPANSLSGSDTLRCAHRSGLILGFSIIVWFTFLNT